MRCVYFLLIVAISPLFSCTRSDGSVEDRVVVLSVAESGVSKAGSLTAGDEVAVYARVEGTERYFLEAAKFTAGADGKTLSTTPAVQYPEAKQAVQFYAYFPYHTGAFSVPTDQSTVAALKQADLCWATASSTPVSTGVPLSFEHRMARLVVSANEPIERLTVPNVSVGGTLDVRTGAFTNTTKSDVSTTGNELILPAQPLSRLVLTVANIEYVFDGSLSLLAGQTTTLNLTLHPNTKTATLNGSTTTKWGAATGTGDTNAPINNQLKLHWAAPHASYAAANKITLTLENPTTKATQTIDVTPTLVSGESSTAACAYTLPVSLAANSGLWYPYTVTHAKIYQGSTLLREATPEAMKGTTVYRSGPQTMAINRYIQVRDAATNTTDIKEWFNVDKNYTVQQVKVTTVGCDTWAAVVSGGDGVYVLPATGQNGDMVTICWPLNPTTSAKNGRLITFALTDSPTIQHTIATSQIAGPGGVLINGLLWATGNLVATGNRGSAGVGGARVGAPSDGGLYFQFGGLIGFKGGSKINGGNGTGVCNLSGWWNGGSGYSWEGEAYLWPTNMVGTKNTWPLTSTTPGVATLNDYYFNYTSGGWEIKGKDIRSFNTLSGGIGTLGSGRYSNKGVGDPCTYYLDAQWRLPTNAECIGLTGKSGAAENIRYPWGAAGLTARIVPVGQTIGGQTGPGAWLGSGMSGTTTPDVTKHIYLPMAGQRSSRNGSCEVAGERGVLSCSTTSTTSDAMTTIVYRVDGITASATGAYRSEANIVRCVRTK